MVPVRKSQKRQTAVMRAQQALRAAYLTAKDGDTPFLIVKDGFFFEVRLGKLERKGPAPERVKSPVPVGKSFKFKIANREPAAEPIKVAEIAKPRKRSVQANEA